jgi:two-component system C4-dicarboxylate transport sensor histidine kinase DctB
MTEASQMQMLNSALRKSEERFQAIFNQAAVGIAQVSLSGHWLLINQKICDVLGYSCKELRRLTVQQVSHPDEAGRHLPQIQRLLAGEITTYNTEKRYIHREGWTVWVNLNVTLVRDHDGAPEYFIAVVQDINEQKRVRGELQQANLLLAQRVAERTAELSETVERLQDEITERISMGAALQAETTERHNVQAELRDKELLLIHQNRLAAMGEMIGNIAHQWRQPLNLLGLLAQDLTMTFKSGEFSQDYLEANVSKMLDTIDHMSQTIDDFRNFFRPFKQKVDFKVLEVVKKTISLLEGSLKADQITTEVKSSGDPVVNGYPNEFSQVLVNIMVNARDALVAKEVTSPKILIEIGVAGERAVLTITDNGGGIPEEVLSRIFDPYFTTKGADQGTGVGLFLSKTIIEKNMGGTLSAGNVGHGARFRIVI